MPQTEPLKTKDVPVVASRLRWRSLLRFQLRTLLVLMVLVAVCLGYWSHRARQQRDAVATFKPFVRSMSYDFQEEKLREPPYWPAWLVDALGVDYFASVTVLSLNDRVTDTDLVHLQGLTALEKLELDNPHLTDAGLINLKSLTKLNWLDLDHTQVTDAGLRHIENLTALKWLDLSDTAITDAGIARLENLTVLEGLHLTRTHVTDSGVARLKSLTAMKYLWLFETQVTDASVAHLKNLTTLKMVDLTNTRVTTSGIATLQLALPECEIRIKIPEVRIFRHLSPTPRLLWP